ncbi:MAG: hypothetical protein HY243_09915 [Proteobacteria bacterium]|nr:hypothetical protein [Pseudomonadota bacterium]
MALPKPQPGLIIRYDYLWNDEAAKGRDPAKERPTCLIAASDDTPNPRFVVILPITHRKPVRPALGIEIPPAVKQALGLDDARSWIIVSECNVDEWPTPGLSAVAGRRGVFAYGALPPTLFERVRESFLKLLESSQAKTVRR